MPNWGTSSSWAGQGVINAKWVTAGTIGWLIAEWPVISKWQSISKSRFVESKAVMVDGHSCQPYWCSFLLGELHVPLQGNWELLFQILCIFFLYITVLPALSICYQPSRHAMVFYLHFLFSSCTDSTMIVYIVLMIMSQYILTCFNNILFSRVVFM